MSGTGEDPIPGFPAIGQYEVVDDPDIRFVNLDDPNAMQDLHTIIAEAVGEDPNYQPEEDPNPEDEDPEEDPNPEDDDDDLDDDEDGEDPEAHDDTTITAHGDDDEPIDPDDDDPYREGGV